MKKHKKIDLCPGNAKGCRRLRRALGRERPVFNRKGTLTGRFSSGAEPTKPVESFRAFVLRFLKDTPSTGNNMEEGRVYGVFAALIDYPQLKALAELVKKEQR